MLITGLARAANTSLRARRRPVKQQIRPGVQSLLDAMTDAPAFVRNGRLDIFAINPLGQAHYARAFTTAARPVNPARFCFLDPAAEFRCVVRYRSSHGHDEQQRRPDRLAR
jgi:hypothetical protein